MGSGEHSERVRGRFQVFVAFLRAHQGRLIENSSKTVWIAIAGIDRRIGLQHDLPGSVILPMAGKDAGNYGIAQPHRIADRVGPVTLTERAIPGGGSQDWRLGGRNCQQSQATVRDLRADQAAFNLFFRF